MEEDPITPEKVDELLRFIPLFEVPGRDFLKEWDKYPVYADEVMEFYRLAGQHCWSDYGYVPTEAYEMVHDDEFIERATLEDVKTMLTYCVRGERFADGHWWNMLKTGRVVAILKRLRSLRASIA